MEYTRRKREIELEKERRLGLTGWDETDGTGQREITKGTQHCFLHVYASIFIRYRM